MKRAKKLLYIAAGGVGVLALQMAFHLAGPTAIAAEEHPTAAVHGQTHIVVAPFAEGQVEAWQAWAREWAEDEEGVVAFNKRHGLTRQAGWLAQTPNGPMAVILHEGPGAEMLMKAMSESEHEYDVAMVAKLSELHGVDFNAPPPGPPPACQFDITDAGSWLPDSEHPTEHPE